MEEESESTILMCQEYMNDSSGHNEANDGVLVHNYNSQHHPMDGGHTGSCGNEEVATTDNDDNTVVDAGKAFTKEEHCVMNNVPIQKEQVKQMSTSEKM